LGKGRRCHLNFTEVRSSEISFLVSKYCLCIVLVKISLSPSNKPIQLPDQFPLTLAAFLTTLQMIEKSRQVQAIAQLNAQVIEVFAAGEIERDLS